MDKELLKLSIKNTNLRMFTSSQLIAVFVIILMIAELVGAGILCAYMENTIGWNPGMVVTVILVPCVIAIATQLIYIVKVYDEYDKLVKENEKTN